MAEPGLLADLYPRRSFSTVLAAPPNNANPDVLQKFSVLKSMPTEEGVPSNSNLPRARLTRLLHPIVHHYREQFFYRVRSGNSKQGLQAIRGHGYLWLGHSQKAVGLKGSMPYSTICWFLLVLADRIWHNCILMMYRLASDYENATLRTYWTPAQEKGLQIYDVSDQHSIPQTHSDGAQDVILAKSHRPSSEYESHLETPPQRASSASNEEAFVDAQPSQP